MSTRAQSRASESTAVVRVVLERDTRVEADESLTIEVVDSSGSLTRAPGTLDILDDN